MNLSVALFIGLFTSSSALALDNQTPLQHMVVNAIPKILAVAVVALLILLIVSALIQLFQRKPMTQTAEQESSSDKLFRYGFGSVSTLMVLLLLYIAAK